MINIITKGELIMKHILRSIISLILISLLTGCGISQTEYDTLVEQNKQNEQEISSLSSQVESLSAENESLSTENESLSAENDSLSSQIETLSEYKANQVQNTMDKSYGKAWATTAFGDNTLCFSDDNDSYFQCISEKTYSISSEGIVELWSDIKNAVSLLSVMRTTYPNKIEYTTISIKFFDPSNTYILDVNLKQNGNSYSLDSIVCNILYTDKIIPALMSNANN